MSLVDAKREWESALTTMKAKYELLLDATADLHEARGEAPRRLAYVKALRCQEEYDQARAKATEARVRMTEAKAQIARSA